jgi:hypothetical protein
MNNKVSQRGGRAIGSSRLVLPICLIAYASMACASSQESLGFMTELGRSLERILIVGSAALSLYYGYRLFSLSTAEQGELAAKMGSWQLNIARVGPGVFFALFGSAVLVYALSQSTSIKTESSGATEVHGALGVAVKDKDQRTEVLRAVNTLSQLVTTGSLPPTPEALETLRRVSNALEPVRKQLVDQRFGEGAYAEWARLSQLQAASGSPNFAREMEDPKVKQRFNEVDDETTATLEDER